MATNIPGDINQTRQRNASPVAKKQTSFDVTNTPGLKPAAIPPVAAPGYSSFSPVRDLQRADDSRNQRQAVAAAGVTDKVDRLTEGSVDKLMQDGAVATAKPLIPTPLVTGNNPQRAAQMQAQLNQPVTRGEGMPIQPVVAGVAPAGPSLGAQAVEGFGNRVKDFSTGALQTGIGAVGTVAGTVADAGRQGLAYVSGGELQDPNRFANTAGDFMGQGVDRLTGAFDGAAGATRQLIGATEAKPKPAVAGEKPAENTTKTAATGSQEASKAVSESAGDARDQTVDPLVAGVERGGDGGKTSFSVAGQRGDARSAIESNEAALVERRKMSDLTRKAQIEGEIGNGPGNRGNVSEYAIEQAQRKAKVTGSATDRANYDRLAGIGTAQSASERKQIEEADPRWKQDADRQKAEAEAAKATTDQQLSDANAQQQTARAKNLAFLEAQMVDPNLTADQRIAASNARDVLTTPVKDRGVVLVGGSDGEGGKQASTWRDLTTPPQGRTTATKAEVANAAKESGETEEQVMIRMRARGITING